MTFKPECTGLLQGKDDNWSRTHSIYATLDCHCHRDSHEAHQQVSPEIAERHGLALVSFILRTAIQHLVNLKPSVPFEVFLSRGHVDVEGFLSGISPEPLAVSTTVPSYHRMEWQSFQACSAAADFSSIPRRHTYLAYGSITRGGLSPSLSDAL